MNMDRGNIEPLSVHLSLSEGCVPVYIIHPCRHESVLCKCRENFKGLSTGGVSG